MILFRRKGSIMEENLYEFKVVKKAIDEWDPIGLLAFAPDDEYDSESREIVENLSSSISMEEIAELIAKIFAESFNRADITMNRCIIIANKIYKSIHIEDI